jgi:hypothetical protein
LRTNGGGFELDVTWEGYEVLSIKIQAKFDGECRIEFPASQKNLSFVDDNGTLYTVKNSILTLNVAKEIRLNVKK